MLCASKIHPFSLGNHLGTSLIIGNLMIVRVISVKGTWLGLEWPPSYFFGQNMSLRMFTTWKTLDCILEHTLIITLAQAKVKGGKLQKEGVTLALDVNLVGTDKLKLLVIYTSKQSRCFGRCQPHEYVRWHSNKTTWMREINLKLGFCSSTINSKVKFKTCYDFR